MVTSVVRRLEKHAKDHNLTVGQVDFSDANVINLTGPAWTGVVFEQLCMYQPSLISVSDRPEWIDGTNPDR